MKITSLVIVILFFTSVIIQVISMSKLHDITMEYKNIEFKMFGTYRQIKESNDRELIRKFLFVRRLQIIAAIVILAMFVVFFVT